MFLELDVEVSFSFDSSSTTGFEFNSLPANLLTVLRVIYAIVRPSSEPCGLDVTISTRYDWSVAKQSTSYSLRHWNLRNLTLQQECYLTTFLSITRDLNRQHKTFTRLYNAAASPASRLRSAGSLAINKKFRKLALIGHINSLNSSPYIARTLDTSKGII